MKSGAGGPFERIEYARGVQRRINLLRYQQLAGFCVAVCPKFEQRPQSNCGHNQSDHRLRRHLVGNAQTRSKVGEIILHIS